MTLNQELSQEQRKHELDFCATAFSNPADTLNYCAWLSPDMFLDEDLRKFWEGMLDHGDQLKAANEAGVTIELYGHMTELPTVLRPEEYARLVSKGVYLRNIMQHVSKLVKSVKDRDVDAVRAELRDANDEVDLGMDTDAIGADQVGSDFRDMIDQIDVVRIQTGIPDIDDEIGGLFVRELSILAARPGTGKTAISMEIARQCAESGYKVLFFSLEMDRRQLWARMACGEAGYSWMDLRAGYLTPTQLDEVKDKSKLLEARYGSKIIIDDKSHTVSEINSATAQISPDLAIVDHLGELVWHDKREKRNIWYGQATKFLRDYVAKGLDCHVLLIHQLNREVESRGDKRPTLASLRWSGDLEQLADIVLMLYRDDMYNEISGQIVRVPIEVWVRKHRQGRNNVMISLMYDLVEQRFYTPTQSGPLTI